MTHPRPAGVAGIVAAADEFDTWRAEQKRREAQTFGVGALVRLHDDVGSRAQQAVTFRVERLPNPKAKRKADRAYGIVPVTGGRSLAAEASHLRPATPAEVAKAQAAPAAETFVFGEVCVPKDRNIRGADPFTKLVVLDVTVKGLKLAKLGGDNGRYWTGIPAAFVQKVPPC